MLLIEFSNNFPKRMFKQEFEGKVFKVKEPSLGCSFVIINEGAQ